MTHAIIPHGASADDPAPLPTGWAAARARLDRAMALPVPAFDADRLAYLLDKRDQLLALADTSAKLTGGATGAA